MENYDILIIGAGLGGLACGAILSKEGKKVCILEQQQNVGGCLQSFMRRGYTLDTGMHYVGSLSEGQTLHQYFKYFGILDKIQIKELDVDGFDVIDFGDGKQYSHAIGHERFIDNLSTEFPEERKAIADYIKLIKLIGNYITPDVLRTGKISNGGEEFMSTSAYDTINRLFKSERLKNVIAGSIPLYGYDVNKSSLYEHGMIHNSNIEGSYRFQGNTQHVADALVQEIKKNGGEVLTRSKVTSINVNDGEINSVEVNNDLQIDVSAVISSIHPSITLSLLKNNSMIKKAFFTRVNSLENSFGLFSTYILLKPKTFKYINKNYYFYNTNNVWSHNAEYKNCNIPVVLLSCQKDINDEYASVLTLMTPMDYGQVKEWDDTYVGKRPNSYKEFKDRYSNAMVDFVLRFMPSLKQCIESIFSTSPLSYRDYNSTPFGSAYGIIKDYNNPIISHLSPRTKIRNLYFTGQNLNVHGCLGTTVSAAVTCSEILGKEYLSKKIGNV